MTEVLDGKLPVIEVMGDAAAFVIDNAGRLLTAILPAGVILCLIQYFIASAEENLGDWMEFGILTVQALPYAVIAISVHRITLLGGNSVPTWGILTWSMREVRFVGWLLALYAAMVGIVLAPLLVLLLVESLSGGARPTFGLLSSIGLIVVYFASLYLFSRLAMLFPATAVDRKPGLKWSWSLTEGNGWRIFLATMFFPGLIVSLVGALCGFLLLKVDEAFINVFFQPIGIVGMVWAITILSLSYKYLVQDGTDGDSSGRQYDR